LKNHPSCFFAFIFGLPPSCFDLTTFINAKMSFLFSPLRTAFCTQNKISGTQNKISGTQNKISGTNFAIFHALSACFNEFSSCF